MIRINIIASTPNQMGNRIYLYKEILKLKPPFIFIKPTGLVLGLWDLGIGDRACQYLVVKSSQIKILTQTSGGNDNQ